MHKPSHSPYLDQNGGPDPAARKALAEAKVVWERPAVALAAVTDALEDTAPPAFYVRSAEGTVVFTGAEEGDPEDAPSLRALVRDSIAGLASGQEGRSD